MEYLEKAEEAGYSIEELKNIAKFNGLSSEEIKILGQRLSNAKKELELKDEVLNKIEPKKNFLFCQLPFQIQHMASKKNQNIQTWFLKM